MIKASAIILSIALSTACGGGNTTADSPTPIPTPEPLPDPIPDPIPIPELTQSEASRLLAQASFGATSAQIQQVIELGREQWITQQISLTPSLHVPHLQTLEPLLEEDEQLWRQHRMETWFHHAITADDQLRQRVAFALSEIFVISEVSAFSDDTYGITNYYDLLLEHAFDNYRDLLEHVTLSPVMGMYLSMLGNEKPNIEENIRPDENYAREVMQLFSIGLVELNLDGSPKLVNGNTIATYDQDIIKAFAHIYTGWNFNGTTEDTWWQFHKNYQTLLSMTPVQAFHDTSEKQLLNNFIVPANQTAEQDLEMALDNIFQHENVGPFISKQLIQRLVTSNPTADYVARVASIFNDNGENIRGDLAAVVLAILTDEEATNGHINNAQTFGKVREPLIRATHLWRAFDATSPNGRYQFGWPDYFFAQAPLAASHVFNFFSPSYSPPGEISTLGLVAPELEITTENYLTRTSNFFAYSTLWGHTNIEGQTEEEERILIKLDSLYPFLEDTDVLLDYLNILLLGGSMSENMRSILADAYQDTADWEDDDKLSNLLFLIMVSPQYIVQK